MYERDLSNDCRLSYEVYKSDKFQNEYSEYFLSSLKDQLSFYYSEEDYNYFRKFFDFFGNPDFDYSYYEEVHKKYLVHLSNKTEKIPKFIENQKEFLQMLYDSNIICAIEGSGEYFHFSYREKTVSNIAPEVPYGDNISYRFHYGLYKKTKMGRFN